MKQFTKILCFALVALATAKPNYKYQAPVAPLPQFRPNVQTTTVTQQVQPAVQVQQVQQQPQSYVQTTTSVQQPAQVVVQQAQPQQQTTFVTAPQLQPTVEQYVQPQQVVQEQYTQTQQQPLVVPQQQVTYTQQQQQPQVVYQQQPQQQLNFLPQQQVLFQPQQPQQVVTQQVVSRPQQTIVTKDIFIHSAPEENEEVQLGKNLDSNIPIRKNYRIVFIKAPSQNLKITSAALKQAQAANEEKTVIYVLSKKPDVTEIQQQLSLSQAEPKVHKPEVYFIKYKTTEEAQRAQQEIQAQYDALGGSTHISDEGIAPVRQVSDGQLNLNNGFPATTSTQYNNAPQVQQVVQPQQTQSFVQSNYETRTVSGGALGVATAPSSKYLPAKTLK
jgi:hypothetical protein